MRMKSKTLLLTAALAALTAIAAPAFAQENDSHAGHDMSAMMAVGESGSWSYIGRENPTMLLHGRWELVPAAGRASEAVPAAGMTPQARCAALMASNDLILDHATQAACSGASQPAMMKNQEDASRDHDMDHDDGGHNH